MKRRKGFTLIEMMIVILVIAVLATIVGLAVRNAGERSKQATLTAHLKVLNDALQMARNDTGDDAAEYTMEQLASASPPEGVDASNWNGPYLTNIPDHPYGGTYEISGGVYVSAAAGG